jgi:hypothetical protein
MPAKKQQPSEQALELDREVMRIKDQVRRKWLQMGKVLSEIQLSLAYRELGFPNFQQYVEDRLGISPRWANYLVCMVRKAKRFKISEEKVAKLDISKGLEIFRLDDAAQARKLVSQTIRQDMSLREVKRQVAIALGRTLDGEPQTVRKVWYFSPSQWTVISQAIKAVNLNTGSDSESYAIELIAADYLAGIGLEQGAQLQA